MRGELKGVRVGRQVRTLRHSAWAAKLGCSSVLFKEELVAEWVACDGHAPQGALLAALAEAVAHWCRADVAALRQQGIEFCGRTAALHEGGALTF